MKTKYIRRICSLILVIVLIISAAIIPADAVSGVIDRNHKGSITLYSFNTEGNDPTIVGTSNALPSVVLSSIGKPIEGVTFTVTRVVKDNFRDYDGRGTTYLTKDGATRPTANEVIASLNSGNGRFRRFNTYSVGPTDSNGKAPTLSNLNLGLYLVQQTGNPDGMIEIAEPMLFTLPYPIENQWNYDVTAYPKSVKGYTLTYDANNGSGAQTTEPRLAGSTSPLTENSFTNGTKVFFGWANSPSATVPDYKDMEDFTMPEENKTIYAVWGYTSQIRYYTAFKYSEPWGLKLGMALVNPKTSVAIDTDQYTSYGFYVYKKSSRQLEGETLPSRAEVMKNGTLYSNTSSDFEVKSLNRNGTTEKYVMLTYDQKINTQNLENPIYTLSYITYKGRTFYGDVKDRTLINSIDQIIESQQVGNTTFTAAEAQLATAIKKMYQAEVNYYADYFKGGGEDESYPNGTDAKSLNLENYNVDSSLQFSTSLRAIDPWGLKLMVTDSIPRPISFDDYGCVVYVDYKRELRSRENSLTFEDLKNMDGAKVYSKTNGGASIYSQGSKRYVLCYEVGNIQNYRLAQTDIYTCFYYNTTSLSTYTVSKVKRRNIYDLAETGKTQTIGKTDFSSSNRYSVEDIFPDIPKTIEADVECTAGDNTTCVIFGNYCDGNSNGFNFYINTNGRPSVYCYTQSNKQSYYRGWNTDIRGRKVHLTLTRRGTYVRLYIDGEYFGQQYLLTNYGENTNAYCVGCDNKLNNYQYFRGTIWSMHAFSDERTDDEIRNDAINGVDNEADNLLYGETFGDYLPYAVYDSMINLYKETYYYRNGYYPTATDSPISERPEYPEY